MRNRLLWIFWLAATLMVAGTALARLYVGGERLVFLPGQTAGVHHQIEIACETCHVSKPFAGQARVRKDLNKTCVTCHKAELKAAEDSHPVKKFKNPRMAAYWEKIDARFCTSCHAEHQPETTLAGLLTLPGDYCVACHSEGEQDVRVNRPTHAGLDFGSCASAGCHNYHDNKALYEDFLVKHAGEPWLAATPVHPAAALARARPRPAEAEIAAYLAAIAAPAAAQRAEATEATKIGEAGEAGAHWAASAHAAADVGCAGCHAPRAETAEEIDAAWEAAPGEAVCARCHKAEAKTFALGRHGMRRHPELAAPRKAKTMLKRLGWKTPPEGAVDLAATVMADPAPAPLMNTAQARLHLADSAHDRDLTCNSCHAPHAQDLSFAATGACLSCHADDHSRAYEGSPHHGLWQAEQAGQGAPGSGVTCATCHMPQTARKGKTTTNHNQNDTIRPNEKMIRPVCMTCHSLEFSIDALADADLVKRNFTGRPNRHVESIDWAVSRVDQPDEGANQ